MSYYVILETILSSQSVALILTTEPVTLVTLETARELLCSLWCFQAVGVVWGTFPYETVWDLRKHSLQEAAGEVNWQVEHWETGNWCLSRWVVCVSCWVVSSHDGNSFFARRTFWRSLWTNAASYLLNWKCWQVTEQTGSPRASQQYKTLKHSKPMSWRQSVTYTNLVCHPLATSVPNLQFDMSVTCWTWTSCPQQICLSWWDPLCRWLSLCECWKLLGLRPSMFGWRILRPDQQLENHQLRCFFASLDYFAVILLFLL